MKWKNENHIWTSNQLRILILMSMFLGGVACFVGHYIVTPDCPGPVDTGIEVIYEDGVLFERFCADSIAVLNERLNYGSGTLPDKAISQRDIDSLTTTMRAIYCSGTVSIAAVDSFLQSHMNLYACGNDSLSWYACITGHDLNQFLKQARGL